MAALRLAMPHTVERRIAKERRRTDTIMEQSNKTAADVSGSALSAFEMNKGWADKAVAQLPQITHPGIRSLADLLVSNGIADTDVHDFNDLEVQSSFNCKCE